MVMVSVVNWQPTGELMALSQSDWPKGRRPPGGVLHSSHEPGELSRCHKHGDIITKIIRLLC